MFDEGLTRLPETEWPWWERSRGGDIGSLLTLTDEGEVDGGGVLTVLTDNWGGLTLVLGGLINWSGSMGKKHHDRGEKRVKRKKGKQEDKLKLIVGWKVQVLHFYYNDDADDNHKIINNDI